MPVERERDVVERRAFAVVAGQPVELDGRGTVLDGCAPAAWTSRSPSAGSDCGEALLVLALGSRDQLAHRRLLTGPSRSSATGSGSPFTIPSKNCLRSW